MDKVDLVQGPPGPRLRSQLERLDALLLRSAGIEPDKLTFQFRPLWQLDASAKAAVALSKAQTTAVYAGLNLWPTKTTAALVRSQLLEDGTYPAAGAVLGGETAAAEPAPARETCPDWAQSEVVDFDPSQARDPDGKWTKGGGSGPSRLSASMPQGSSQSDLMQSLIGGLHPTGTAQVAKQGAEAALSAIQTAQSKKGDNWKTGETTTLLKAAIVPMLPLLSAQNSIRSAYSFVANLLLGKASKPSDLSGNQSEAVPAEPPSTERSPSAPGVPANPNLPVPYDGEYATQQLLGTTTTPGGRTIMSHAAGRMVDPPPGRVPMSPQEVDQVLDNATRVVKRTDGPNGPTLTIENSSLPGRPRVIIDEVTGQRIITVVNRRRRR